VDKLRLYHSRHSVRRRERATVAVNQQLELQISSSGPDIQTTYDADSRKLGSVFARGDNIGQYALMRQLIILQQTVISLLASSNPVLSSTIHQNHSQIQDTTSSVHSGAITTLGEQYQRLLQPSNVQATQVSSASATQCSPYCRVENVWSNDRYYYQCNTCGWKADNSNNRIGE
jgi:hypothetical protein